MTNQETTMTIDQMLNKAGTMSRLWDEAAAAVSRRDDEAFRKAMDQFWTQRRAARHD